jgi:DEAD/DEAH box helicase domain-containing protein
VTADPAPGTATRSVADAVDTLDAIARAPDLFDRVVHRTTLPARTARTAVLREPFHPEVAARLSSRGIDALYTHQVEAIDRIRGGEHVVVATGTASGKSLCYQLPIVDAVVRGESDTALLVYPTKALAQDQLRSLRGWLVPGLKAVTYDGDTPPDDRAWARKNATVLLTNPEMVHQGILPYHQRWSTFLMRLRIVVVDELHATPGIFGSNVAHVLRRLRVNARVGWPAATNRPRISAVSTLAEARAPLTASSSGRCHSAKPRSVCGDPSSSTSATGAPSIVDASSSGWPSVALE